MGTRSIIALHHNDEYKSIYCHWDGQFTGVGQELKNNYNTLDAVKELIDGGSLSTLVPNLKRSDYKDTARYEESNLDKFLNELKDHSDIEYFYMFKNGEWLGLEVNSMKNIKNEFKKLSKF